jgi:hypothetical protein
VFSWVHDRIGAALWRASLRSEIMGVPVGVPPTHPDGASVRAALYQALNLLASHEPAAFQRLRRLFKGIMVVDDSHPEGGLWHPRARLCVIRSHVFLRRRYTTELIALTIAGLGMQATLGIHGPPATKRDWANREVLCAMAQLAVARKLPVGDDLIDALHRLIDQWSKGAA